MKSRTQITLSILAIAAVMASGQIASAIRPATMIEVSPTIIYTIGETRDIPPDPPQAFEREQWAVPTTIAVHHTTPRARIWACGAPRRLENDATQTVR